MKMTKSVTEAALIKQLLTRRQLTLEDIVRACPFDPILNQNGLISSDAFFDNMFVKSVHTDDMVADLCRCLDSQVYSTQIVFLHGHAGTGKSTFLRHFARTQTDYSHVFVDLHYYYPRTDSGTRGNSGLSESVEMITSRLEDHLSDGSEIPVKTQMQFRKMIYEMKSPPDDIHKTITNYLLDEHKTQLIEVLRDLCSYLDELNQYFSQAFLDTLSLLPDAQEVKHYLRDILVIASLDDIFALFAWAIVRDQRDPEKMLLVHFDNLDRVDLDYLAVSFTEALSRIMLNVTLLFKEECVEEGKYDFRSKVRFVFCMREATHAIVNPQLKAGNWRNIEVIPFRHDGDMALCAKVLDSRLRLAAKVFGRRKAKTHIVERSLQVRNVLQIMLPQYDLAEVSTRAEIGELRRESDEGFYFTQVISPLFNCDMKKLLVFLVRESSDPNSMEEILQLTKLALGSDQEKLSKSAKTGRYGLGGDWMFRTARSLTKDEFAAGFFAKIGKAEKAAGHCLLIRMMLSVLLNACGWSYRKMAPANGCSLDTLVRSLIGMYDIQAILDCLAESFLCHERNWVNLVTIENKRIRDKSDFNDIKNLGKVHKFSEKLPLSAIAEWSNVVRDVRELCENIWIRLNRSGFIFLKYVLTHYEFYSVLAGNTKSLFACGAIVDKESKSKTKVYEFERNISRVLDLARNHCADMQTFYRERIKKDLQMSPDKYKQSAYAFKYMGAVGAPRRQEGHFHITRLANAMIGYIEAFRSYLLGYYNKAVGDLANDNGGPGNKPVKDRPNPTNQPLTQEEKVAINRKLVGYLESFAGLHQMSDDRISADFLTEYRKAAEKIKKRDFKDFRTAFERR